MPCLRHARPRTSIKACRGDLRTRTVAPLGLRTRRLTVLSGRSLLPWRCEAEG